MRSFVKNIVLGTSKLIMLTVMLSLFSSLVLNSRDSVELDLTEIVEIDFDEKNQDDEPRIAEYIKVINLNSRKLGSEFELSLFESCIINQLIQGSFQQVPTPPPDLV